MRLGFRSKLFLGSVLLTLLMVMPCGFYLHRALQTWSEEQRAGELVREVNTTRAIIERVPELTQDPERLAALVTQISSQTTPHLEVITTSGEPLAPTSAPVRGEQLEAWRALAASSDTHHLLSDGSMTVVRAFERPELQGWVRASYSAEQLSSVFRRARILMMFAGMLGLGAALLVSWLATLLVGRMMRGLVEHAHAKSHHVDRAVEGGEGGEEAISITQLADELARSVDALARERDRFSTVLESMSEAVIALDDTHCIRLINRAAKEFFAAQLAVVEGHVEGQRVTSMIRIPALLDLIEAAQQGAPSTTEFSLAGTPKRRVMAHITPRAGTEGCLLVMHDVTKLRKLETIRRDFVTNVSHELRTPVSVIMLNSETLLADDDLMGASPHARRFLEGLYRNAERLSRLISDLLDISRLEAGRFGLELEPISVFGACLQVMDALEEKAARKGQHLDVEVDFELLVFADAKALDQMIFNLVDNAIKYAPEGGHIMVHAERVEPENPSDERAVIRIDVCDNGPGLSAKHRPRVFERFYRIDDGRSRDVGGTGLGLAIVKHLAGAMGGRVGVRPNGEQGSVFWIRLPEADAEDEVAFEEAQALEVLTGAHS